MGHRPKPHFHRRKRLWYFTVGGKKYWPKTEAEAHTKLAEILGQENAGMPPGTPTVVRAIAAWRAHNQIYG